MMTAAARNNKDTARAGGGLSRTSLGLLICFLCFPHLACAWSPYSSSFASFFNRTFTTSPDPALPGILLPDHLGFNSVTSDCNHFRPASASPPTGQHAVTTTSAGGDVGSATEAQQPSLKLHLRHRRARDRTSGETPPNGKETVFESTLADLSRIHALRRRITERKNKDTTSRRLLAAHHTRQHEEKEKEATVAALSPSVTPEVSGRLMATLESGVSQGSGEYFMDVFVGTPPRHFSLILDTGSDLNWIQCEPCHDCFEQNGPYYNPAHSSSYRNISCSDPRCGLVSSPDPPEPCRSSDQPCPYYYWYGDLSNTTGDLALESFTVNLTSDKDGRPLQHHVEDVMFGCGHWNRGLFHGAAGLLGLGRGPLSFSSQLRSIYGQTFSYCLVDRNSNMSVSSKLVLGEDKGLLSHPELKYTSFVAGKANPADTFYYVGVKGVMVGGEVVDIPSETWELKAEGGGGTIIDSGTTLSYFAEPAYGAIRNAFVKKVGKRYPVVEGFPVLDPCYNVSGAGAVELPEFAILFKDGAVWNFPPENYFIRLEPEEIICLAMLGTPRSSLSILGNYQQQNFHILYDTSKSRLGFAPRDCAHI